MFWEKSGELFRCLPLIEASGEEQLQFMFDIATVNEGNVNVPMLTARYAFLRSTSSVGAITRNGKSLGGADIEKLLDSYKPVHTAGSCNELIRSYCSNVAVYEICDCCPCSSTYKNKNRKEEFEVLAYILSNGGPVYVDLQDLGIDDLPSLVKSQEPIPFGKVANKFVPYPLFQKIAEYMIESAFACVNADAFWEGFSGVVYSRKAKQYKYGKIDETALSYIKNVVYSLFDDRYKELNFDNLRVLMGSTSVGDDDLTCNMSVSTQPIDIYKVKDADESSSELGVSSVVISESADVVVLESFFDKGTSEPASKDSLDVSEEIDKSCVKEDKDKEDTLGNESVSGDVSPVINEQNVVNSFDDKEMSESIVDEPFLAMLGVKEDVLPEIVNDPSLVGAWDSLGSKHSRNEASHMPNCPSASFPFKSQEGSAYDKAEDELLCGGFLLKKKKGINADVLPVGIRGVSSGFDSDVKKSSVESMFASITGRSFSAAEDSTVSASGIESPAECAESLGFTEADALASVDGCSVDVLPSCECCDEGFVVTVNGKTRDSVNVSNDEEISCADKDKEEAPVIQIYRDYTNDGMIEPVSFKDSKTLCPGTVFIYNKAVSIAKSSNAKDFIDLCRALEGASDVSIEVAKVGDEVGLLILLDRMYFTTYSSDAYGVLHSLFNNRKCRKICFDMFILAQYVYMYDSAFENVYSVFQYSGVGVDITSVNELEDYIPFIQKQAVLPVQACSEYLAYMATHALSSDVGHYINASVVNGPNGFLYDFKSAEGVGERVYGAVFELSGFNKDVDSGIGFDKIVFNAIRILFYSHIIHKYNLKIVEIGDSSIKVYAPYNIYEVLDMLILAFSNSIKQLTGGVPSFVCVPIFVKKPTK